LNRDSLIAAPLHNKSVQVELIQVLDYYLTEHKMPVKVIGHLLKIERFEWQVAIDSQKN